jgi:hypothetical protein
MLRCSNASGGSSRAFHSKEEFMLKVEIKGLEKLQREFADAMRALSSLDGTIATVKIDPTDPGSARKAIRTMESAVNAKVARYRGSALVEAAAKQFKASYREKRMSVPSNLGRDDGSALSGDYSDVSKSMRPGELLVALHRVRRP